MMWKILFLFLATAAATHQQHKLECGFNMYHQCDDPKERPEEFPGAEEELEEFCRYAFKFFQCANSAMVNCSEDDRYITYLRQLNSNVIRVCNKDSLLYSALVGSLPCLKRNMNNMTPCPRMSEDFYQTFSDNLAGIGITDVEVNDNEPACVYSLYSLGCIASKAGKACGDITRQVVVDIIQGFDMPFSSCRPGVKEKIPAIAEMLQLEAEKEKAVEDTIEEKK